MHKYLPAIGFSNIKNKKELNEILKKVQEGASRSAIISYATGAKVVEYLKLFANKIGILVRGEMTEEESFEREYYIPYFAAEMITSTEEAYVQRLSDREAYQCICSDLRMGVPMIFYLQNMMDYLTESFKREEIIVKSCSVTALARDGMILLPTEKRPELAPMIKRKNNKMTRLMNGARNGDPEALELLAFEDIDTQTVIARRIRDEDVYSIVESYVMPYGLQNDEYTILGEILYIEEVTNEYTNEEVYIMKINTNSIIMDICINKSDVTGEPEIGRRLKATAWFQGSVQI